MQLLEAPRRPVPGNRTPRRFSSVDRPAILPLGRRQGGTQAYKFVLPVGPDDAQPELRAHEGHDWAFVLSGRLRPVLGEHDLILEPGEAAELGARVPHWFSATASGPVEFHRLVGKQGERAHIRATSPRP